MENKIAESAITLSNDFQCKKEIEIVCFDDDATPFATFQSHCQKVVSNEKGIFLTYIKSRNEAYTAQNWRLVWSGDEGRTFRILYESTDATNPAPLETDEENNIYLVYPDFVDKHSYFLKFKASENYARPAVTRIENSMGGKVCMTYYRDKKRFYYFSNNGTFHILNTDGELLFSNQIIRHGKKASLEYPFLTIDDHGTIHAAWTTNMYDKYYYLSIQYMKSEDGGYTWKKMNGEPLELPVISDYEGKTDRITSDEEFEYNTWLSSFIALNGKLHFFYRASPHKDYTCSLDDNYYGKQHYIRYDIASGKKDFEIIPDFKGETIRIMGFDGYFAVESGKINSPLYCISKHEKRIACIVSHDNGLHWQDYALSREMDKDTFSIYAIGGCREIAKDGYIIGSFTERCGDFVDIYGKSKAHFIKIRA